MFVGSNPTGATFFFTLNKNTMKNFYIAIILVGLTVYFIFPEMITVALPFSIGIVVGYNYEKYNQQIPKTISPYVSKKI